MRLVAYIAESTTYASKSEHEIMWLVVKSLKSEGTILSLVSYSWENLIWICLLARHSHVKIAKLPIKCGGIRKSVDGHISDAWMIYQTIRRGRQQEEGMWRNAVKMARKTYVSGERNGIESMQPDIFFTYQTRFRFASKGASGTTAPGFASSASLANCSFCCAMRSASWSISARDS